MTDPSDPDQRYTALYGKVTSLTRDNLMVEIANLIDFLGK